MKVEKVIPLQIGEHPRFEETLAFKKKCINKKNDQETDSRKDGRNHGDITQSEAVT